MSEYLSPQGPAFIGPTPQRDGIVLGLFDNLNAETPSKRRIIFGEIDTNVFQTPTKKDAEVASEASSASRIRGERTPQSISKRNLFNHFITPKKRKLDEEGTPSSTLRGLATPAFLRRDNALDKIEEADETTPRPAPWKRRGMVRSLSAMIQNMRKDEDDRLDEEAEIMRELEMEEEGIPAPSRPRVSQVQVGDSQAEMPLGVDRGESENEDEEEEEEELGRDGQPRKVWKKKGLKRQTRRTNSEFSSSTLRSVESNNVQCDPILSSQNLSPNSSTTTKMKNQNPYRKHKQNWMRNLHSLMIRTTPTTRAMSPTQQRSVKRQRRSLKSRLRRKKAWSRKLRGKFQPLHMRTTSDSRSRGRAGTGRNQAEGLGGDDVSRLAVVYTWSIIKPWIDESALSIPRLPRGFRLWCCSLPEQSSG